MRDTIIKQIERLKYRNVDLARALNGYNYRWECRIAGPANSSWKREACCLIDEYYTNNVTIRELTKVLNEMPE